MYFANEWCWTYDPRRTDATTVPFLLFPIQEELLHWLEGRVKLEEDGLVEKSRDMGLTWLCCLYLVHSFLFKPGFKGAIGSRKEELVDRKGDPDCIFEKIRFLLRSIPKWMLPEGYEPKVHDNFMRIIHPSGEGAITGEAGDNIGRGGRNSIYFLDENAFMEHADLIEAAVSQNTKVRIYVSTPHGVGNMFYQKRMSGKTKVFTMHWKHDLRKNAWQVVRKEDGYVSLIGGGVLGTKPPDLLPEGYELKYPWYENEKERTHDLTVLAQEVDIDYTASIEGICIPAKWVRAAVELSNRIAVKGSGRKVVGLDVADGGQNKSIYILRHGPKVSRLLSRQLQNTTDTANWALRNAQKDKADFINYDSVGVGAGVGATYKVKQRTERLGVTIRAINGGSAVSPGKWSNGKKKKDMFLNLRAETWWTLRDAFEKTYEFIEEKIQHPVEQMISIPDDQELQVQLSSVLYFDTDGGKIKVESKKDMRKRGVKSPDKADALAMTYAPIVTQLRMAAGGVPRDTGNPVAAVR